MPMSRRSIANAIEERMKRTFAESEIVHEVIERVIPVVQGDIKDLDAIQRVMTEVLPMLEEVRDMARRGRIKSEALLSHLKEDEEVASDFIHRFAADATLVTNLTEIMAVDPVFVAQVLEVAEPSARRAALGSLDVETLTSLLNDIHTTIARKGA